MTPTVKTACILVFFLGLLIVSSANVVAADNRTKEIAILISREISAFITVVEGLEKAFPRHTLQRFFLDTKGEPYSLGGTKTLLHPERYEALVAIGPRALRYLDGESTNRRLLFGMVLNPENVISDPVNTPCGVSLNMSIPDQFLTLKTYLPQLKRLGVFFDPANNQSWFDLARETAEPLGIDLVPLHVERYAGRLRIVGNIDQVEAVMFIPDKTIISRAIIQHAIKQSALKSVPAIGYNNFFLDSGAVLSFVIDYEQVGRQIASQLELILTGDDCRGILSPSFRVAINQNGWKKFNLPGRQSDDTD